MSCGNLAEMFAELTREPFAVDLTVRISWQRTFPDVNYGRLHIGGAVTLAFAFQIARGDRCTRTRCGDDDDCLPEYRMRHSEGGNFPELLDGVEYFFEFGWAHA